MRRQNLASVGLVALGIALAGCSGGGSSSSGASSDFKVLSISVPPNGTWQINRQIEIAFSQHNGEGDIVDAVQALRGRADGALINAGAYSHTSLAIRDALAGVKIPFVEIHLTNIFAREPERRRSALADAALAVICGFGAYGYELALRGLVKTLPVAAGD